VNFGQNLFTWLQSNLQAVVLIGIAVMGVNLIIKREMSKLFGLIVVALIAVGFVFNPNGVMNVLLNLFNTIFGT